MSQSSDGHISRSVCCVTSRTSDFSTLLESLDNFAVAIFQIVACSEDHFGCHASFEQVFEIVLVF